MDKVLFNAHDIVLWLNIAFYIILIATTSKNTSTSNRAIIYFYLFCLASISISLDTLINFGAEFRPFMLDRHPNMFFVFELGFWLQAPFFYLFIKSRKGNNFRETKVHLLMFAPCLLYFVHQCIFCPIMNTHSGTR